MPNEIDKNQQISSFQTKPLKEWDTHDISQWLQNIGMKPYISTFTSQRITGMQLSSFNEDDLRIKCKITARPIRKILYKRLKHVQGKWKDYYDEMNASGMCEVDQKESSEKDDDGHEEEKRQCLSHAVSDEDPLPEDTFNDTTINTSTGEVLNDTDADAKKMKSPEEAAINIQGMYKCWKAHQLVVRLIREQYIKVYSLQSGHYVYQFIGKAKEEESSEITKMDSNRIISKLGSSGPILKKPFHLGSLDLSIKFTTELAIARIQMFARYCCTIKRVRLMVRKVWKQILDPISGRLFYFNYRTGSKCWTKPKLLGREKWDTMDMRLWTEEDVYFYFRKMKLGSLAADHIRKVLQKHEIDGPLLLTFDDEDLDRLGIPSKFKNRILCDMKSVPNMMHFCDVSLTRKRERFRNNHKMIQAVIMIQRNFRVHSAKLKLSKWMDVIARYKKGGVAFDKLKWWSNYEFQVISVYDQTSGEREQLIISI